MSFYISLSLCLCTHPSFIFLFLTRLTYSCDKITFSLNTFVSSSSSSFWFSSSPCFILFALYVQHRLQRAGSTGWGDEEEGKSRRTWERERRAGGDSGGSRCDLTRLAGRNKLATRALVPSVPLAIGACRFLSHTGDVSIPLNDSFFHQRGPIDPLSFPLLSHHYWTFDFAITRGILHGNYSKAIPRLLFHECDYASVMRITRMYVYTCGTMWGSAIGAISRASHCTSGCTSRWSDNYYYCHQHTSYRSLSLKLQIPYRSDWI